MDCCRPDRACPNPVTFRGVEEASRGVGGNLVAGRGPGVGGMERPGTASAMLQRIIEHKLSCGKKHILDICNTCIAIIDRGLPSSAGYLQFEFVELSLQLSPVC